MENLADLQRTAYGLGLPAMRERLAQVGGWLDITSSSRGTCATVALPAGRQAD